MIKGLHQDRLRTVHLNVYRPLLALIFLRLNSSSLPSSTYPSALPHWPGLEEMEARTRPVMNWSRRGFSTSLVFCLSAYFLPVFLLILRFSTASSASVSLAPFFLARG